MASTEVLDDSRIEAWNKAHAGEKHARLTIKRYAYGILNELKCYCDCDCGAKDVIINYIPIKRGLSRSCGCYRDDVLREKARQTRQKFLDEYAGKRFNRLTVISEAEEIRKEKTIKCLCDCGRTCYTSPAKLLRGYSKSCGCRNPLTGKSRLSNSNNK